MTSSFPFKHPADVDVLHRLSLVNDFEFTGRRIAKLEGIPPTTVQRSLDRLAEIGLVLRHEHSFGYLYKLNRDHVLWPPVEKLVKLIREGRNA